MSEVIPARIQTVIQVGSADISAMMVQVHIDGLKKEEADLLAKHQGHLAEMNDVYDDMCRRFLKAFEKKRPLIDPLVASINALIGGKRPIVARLHPSVTSRSDLAAWNLFSRYLADPCYGIRHAPMFKETTWKSSWILVFKDESDAGSVEADEGDDGTALEFLGLNDKVQCLTVDIPKVMRERINDIIRRSFDNRLKLHTIRAEMKDLPNLERKVQAALTQQLLASQPDLVRQVNMAISSSGGKLLLEVQE